MNSTKYSFLFNFSFLLFIKRERARKKKKLPPLDENLGSATGRDGHELINFSQLSVLNR
jgi:hypothetical protein